MSENGSVTDIDSFCMKFDSTLVTAFRYSSTPEALASVSVSSGVENKWRGGKSLSFLTLELLKAKACCWPRARRINAHKKRISIIAAIPAPKLRRSMGSPDVKAVRAGKQERNGGWNRTPTTLSIRDTGRECYALYAVFGSKEDER